ncbi:MAG TPA: type II CAAX endopeptidase family protein [Thermomicrobiales bacterium]|nr:type II CAAX endopeptidase family protein [Thermomicrobiales bacterium]
MTESNEARGTRDLRGWISDRQLVSFFLLTYAISWSCWGLSMVGGGPVLFFAGGFGPFISAIIITRLSRKSVRAWLRTLLVWRVRARYYVFALLFPVAVYTAINLVLLALGLKFDFPALPGALTTYLGTLLLVATIGGGLEEPGWRGFALPRLQTRRTPVMATLILGLAWGIWHVPLYGVAGFIVPLVLAFFYTWLYNRTGSVLLCILLHASFTPAQDILTFTSDTPVVDLVILGVYVLGALGFILATRGRLGLERRALVTGSASTPS